MAACCYIDKYPRPHPPTCGRQYANTSTAILLYRCSVKEPLENPESAWARPAFPPVEVYLRP